MQTDFREDFDGDLQIISIILTFIRGGEKHTTIKCVERRKIGYIRPVPPHFLHFPEPLHTGHLPVPWHTPHSW